MTSVSVAMATFLIIVVFAMKPSTRTISSGIAISVLLFACAVGAALQNAPRHAAAAIVKKLEHTRAVDV